VLNKDQTKKIVEYVIGCKLPELVRFDTSRLSELLEVDTSALENTCGEHSPVSAADIILREKVNRSLHIIENSDEITAEELAEKLGFANTQAFIQLFKKNLLVDPDRYIFIVKNRHILKCV